MSQIQEMRCWSGLDELRPLLESHLARRCRDAHELDDIVQETLLRAARYRASLIDPARLSVWVLRIGTNVLRDRVRRENRFPRAEANDQLFDLVEGREAMPDEQVEEEDLALEGVLIARERAVAELCGALGRLRDADREVLCSYYGGAQSCRETSQDCEIAPDLVKVRLFRARRRLLRVLRLRLELERGISSEERPHGGRSERLDLPGGTVEPDSEHARRARRAPGVRGGAGATGAGGGSR
jgi:RNA polymerase sigma factor (sigma-70 family)